MGRHNKSFTETRPHLSDKYQHLYKEISSDFSTPSYQTYDTNRALYADLQEYDENVKEAEANCFAHMQQVVEGHATDVQKNVFRLSVQGKTQAEIGEELGSSQTSVYKCLRGGPTYGKYRTPDGPIIYGGLNKKLTTWLLKDNIFRQLLLTLYQLEPKASNFLPLVRSWHETYEDFIDWMHDPIHPTLGLTMWKIDVATQMIIKFYQTNTCHMYHKVHKRLVPMVMQATGWNQPQLDEYFKVYKSEIVESLKPIPVKPSYAPVKPMIIAPPPPPKVVVMEKIKKAYRTRHKFSEQKLQWLAEDFVNGKSIHSLVETYQIGRHIIYQLMQKRNISRVAKYDPATNIKECSRCHQLKEAQHFAISKTAQHKLSSYCLECMRTYCKQDREKRKVRHV